ncbi:hypothetical protein D3C74_409290 [compost metagenome]
MGSMPYGHAIFDQNDLGRFVLHTQLLCHFIGYRAVFYHIDDAIFHAFIRRVMQIIIHLLISMCADWTAGTMLEQKQGLILRRLHSGV